MRADFVTRVRIIAIALVVIALILLVRLYMLQVMEGHTFRDRATVQYARASGAGLARGTIFFTDKNGMRLSAASLASGYTLAVVPPQIVDAHAAYQAVAALAPVDEATFMAKAGKVNDPYEEVLTHLPEAVGKAVTAAAIPGVRAIPDRWRVYPDGATAAHVVGFMGFNGGDALSGQYGLERSYDAVLSRSGDSLSVNFFADLFQNISARGRVDRPGADLITGIEPTVQGFIESELSRYDREWHPEHAGAIVLDPKTGIVIAMAARPAFDPNNIRDADPQAFSNPLTEHVYEFGSIMKAITMASALDAGVVTPETTYNDTGTATYNASTISNYDGKARGPGTTMQEVLSQSLNVGAANLAVTKLGNERFWQYFNAFGLASPTGIDLPHEAKPLVSHEVGAEDIKAATASFGQGFAVTPIAMTRALAVLANHGMIPSPHVGTALRYPGEPEHVITGTSPTRVISPEAADTVTRMLVTVVDTALRNGTAKIPELSVAAKTGTAQMVNPATKKYYTDRYLHSFFGYFPAYEPRFIIFFFAVAPQGARYSSETWTDRFEETVKFLMNYYQIEPDRRGAL